MIKQLDIMDIPKRNKKLSAPITLGNLKKFYQEPGLMKYLDKWSRWFIRRKKNYKK